MSKNQEEILLEQIKAYIEEDRISQAILINGEWGVGKTHFIQRKLMPMLELIGKEDQSRVDYKVKKEIARTIYISLYGVTSQGEIMEKISEGFLTNIVAEPETITSSVTKSLLKKIENIAPPTEINRKKKHFNLGGLAFSIAKDTVKNGVIAGKLGEHIQVSLSSVYECILQEKIVLIFDDLERVSLDMQETLGYFNNLVENNDAKVIIVANEQKIEHLCNDVSNKCAVYREIKEKTIAFTYLYQPLISDIYQDLVNEKCLEENAKGFLSEEDITTQILNIFQKENCVNIRTFIVFILSFEKLYSVVSPILKNISTESTLERVFYKNLVFQTATGCIKNTTAHNEIANKNSTPDRTLTQMCLSTGCGTEGIFLEHYDFIHNYIHENIISSSYLNKHLKMVVREMQTKSLVGLSGTTLEKLLDWKFSEEEQLTGFLDKLTQELHDDVYATEIYGRIITCLVILEHYVGVNYDFEELKEVVQSTFIEKAKKETDLSYSLEKLKISNQYGTNYELESKHHEFITPLLDIKYYTMASYLEVCNEHAFKAFYTQDKMGSFLLEKLKDSPTETTEIPIKELSFLENVNVTDLRDKILQQELREIYALSQAFQQIYYSSSLRMVFIKDRDKLNDLRDFLDNMVKNTRFKSTRKLAYQHLHQVLCQSSSHIAPLVVPLAVNATIGINSASVEAPEVNSNEIST